MLKELKNNIFVLGLVAILGILLVTPMAKADLDIDLIGISSLKQFRDGVPQGPDPWSLDIGVRVVDSGALHHIDITKPGDLSPFVTLNEEAASGSWDCSLDDDYESLDDLKAVYEEGTYKFDFRKNDDVLIKSLDIAYSYPVEPTEPVEFTYPSTDGQTDVSVIPTFTWNVSPDAGDALMTVVEDDEVVYFDAPVSTSSTSWTPGPLLADHDYELDVFVVNIKDWAGGPEFPTMTDSTGDTFSYSYTTEYLNEIVFTTLSLDDLIEKIEEILEFVDESVKAETLIGDGPGKSAANRLNALINMLEEAQSLIEVELFEEAFQQLEAAYKHTDGQSRPKDLVTGDAATDLADMIQGLMESI